jgi:1-acyl-sn-glycerol-3-phosphate acyltransferase
MGICVGAQVPRRGNAFSRWLGGVVLRLFGFRIEGEVPDHPKMVLVGAPHTSNVDGIIGIAALSQMGLRCSTMIKDTAFKGVMGPLLRWFGAIPINRASPKGVVEQSVEAFQRNDKMLLLITPEGTRSNAPEWKRGFYHIAMGAGVPIMLAAADYERGVITIGPIVDPSGDYEADLARIMAFYREHGRPRHPDRLSKPMCDVLGVAYQPRGK